MRVKDWIKANQIKADTKIVNPVVKMIKVLEVITGKSDYELRNFPMDKLKDFYEVKKHKIEIPTPTKIKPKVRVGLRTFKPVLDARRIDAGLFIDVSELSKGDSLSRLPELIARLWVETTKYRKHLTHDQKVMLVNEMEITKAYAPVVFFCKVSENLLPSMAAYLGELVQDKETANQESSLSVGAG